MSKNILITGGLGYIGSHSCVELIAAGYTPIIIDNLSNSQRNVFDCLKTLTKNDEIIFIEADIKDQKTLNFAFEKYKPISVMHFAG